MNDDKSLIKMPRNGTRLAFLFFIINFLLVFANLYLSNGYIAKTIYEGDQKADVERWRQLNIELRNNAIELKGIADHMEIDAAQNKRIDDIETRTRELEKRR